MLSENLKIRLSHTLYSIIIVLTAYILGAVPEQFYWIHAIKTIIYLFTRFISFKKRKFHYYMCDFCYLVNLFAVYVSFMYPNNITFQKMIFATANGPLALAVIVFRNKVVLHSMDQNTSTFIHISAMLLSYTYRWYSLDHNLYDNESWFSIAAAGIAFYIVWAIGYGIFMFKVLRDRIVEKGNVTMYDWAIENTGLSNLKNITSNEKAQQFMYMCLHGFLTCLSVVLSPIFWYYQWLHFGYILCIITMAFWNGSYYYAKYLNYPKDKKEDAKKDIDIKKTDEKVKEQGEKIAN